MAIDLSIPPPKNDDGSGYTVVFVRYRYVVVAAAGFLLLSYASIFALANVARVLASGRPQNPWVSALIVDGWRATQGLPVFGPQSSSHAALMYGPAEPYLLGLLGHWFPASGQSPHLIALSASLGLVALCLVGVGRLPHPIVYGMAALSFWSIENRVSYFAEGRPDMAAWFFGFAGLILLYRFSRDGHLGDLASGILCIVVGFLFKQTVAMLAVLPPLAALARPGAQAGPGTAWLSAAPLAVLACLVAAIAALAPHLSFYMFQVPRLYPISASVFLKTILDVPMQTPALWVALTIDLLRPAEAGEARHRLLWCRIALPILLVACSLSFAKAGGTVNSLLPWWFATMLYLWLRLGALPETASVAPRAAALLAGATVAAFLTVQPGYFSPVSALRSIAAEATVNASYREAIARTARLDGKVVSPEDPALVLRARGEATRSLYAELDATGWQGWPASLPPGTGAEIAGADYLVDVVDWAANVLGPQHLAELGFVRDWANPSYAIWRRRAAAVPPVQP